MTPDPRIEPGGSQTPSGAATPSPGHGSFGHSLKAIGWGFLGIRKKSGQAEDFARIKPLHLVVIGLVAIVMFVGALIALVKMVATP